MMKPAVLAALLCANAEAKDELYNKVRLQANPIRRVVNMLQKMEQKVQAEGEKEKELFDKFMCYCKNGRGQLEGSIATAKNSNEQLAASIKETDATLKQMKIDLKSAQTDRAEAKAAVAKATALREKEAAAYAKESSELKT